MENNNSQELDLVDNKKRLITSALPYVNNIPHLGNLIQVLSADVYARFCRSRGYETLYICGTDEYGTATETRAREENISPKELCDRYFVEHRDIYKWFNISFDKFGRTSDPTQTQIVQEIFAQVYEAGYISEHSDKQLYSEESQMFLADRYVKGTCPKCQYEDARGDQCEHCGSVLDPQDLINPVSIVDGSEPVIKETNHLYIDLPKILPLLEKWMSEVKGQWSHNALKMTEAWIRDGLRERAITRDLKWGIPVPKEGFENKVFYVWFDAPIGYISITASHTDNWKQWWKNPEHVKLVQFIGKDNIPFHTVLFPSSQLASESVSEEKWTKLSNISSTEYLNYEGGMFSKSRGVGVFGNDVIDTGIPADMWRFYMMYNRPETSDYTFTWNDFRESVNGQLINNLSNLCNRTFTFVYKHAPDNIYAPDMSDTETKKIWDDIKAKEREITNLMEKVQLRKAYKEIFLLCDYGNKLFQDYEPWKLKDSDLDKTKWLLYNLLYLIRDIAVLIEVFTPDTAKNIFSLLNLHEAPQWKDLAVCDDNFGNKHITQIQEPSLLFTKLEKDKILHLKEKFSGDQNSRKDNVSTDVKPKQNKQQSQKLTEFNASTFAQNVCLKTAKVLNVQNHPDADKLYVLTLDDGSEEGRTIVSGLRGHYTEDQLLNKTLIVVANLKPSKLRGVVSNGMLLAASEGEGENEIVDVLFVNNVEPGVQVLPENETATQEYGRLKADVFFSFPLRAKNGIAYVCETPLCVNTKQIHTDKVQNGNIG